MKTLMKSMANMITGSRIILSILLLVFPVFSPGFMAVYLLAGFSDMIDGPIARRTGTVSSFGSRLDTAADICFAAAAFIRIFPEIELTCTVIMVVFTIALLKITVAVCCLFKSGKLPAVHSRMNRLTGLLLFLFPMAFRFVSMKVLSCILCAVAAAAAVQEGFLVFSGTELLHKPSGTDSDP